MGQAVNAIFGCLLSLGGVVLAVLELLASEYRMAWLPVLLLSVGLLMALRHRSEDDVIDLREAAGTCLTCRGAGTVYSAQWNDWRSSGPIQNVRELCPFCQGLDAPRPR